MLTACEQTAMERMQQAVTIGNPMSFDVFPWHLVGAPCAEKPYVYLRVSVSDLRLGFVRNLCPDCARAIGVTQ